MRKIWIPILILFLATSAGAYIYIYRPFTPQKAIESLLPADTAAMVRVCELKAQIQRFKAGRMGKALAGIDLPQFLDTMGVAPAQKARIIQGVADFNTMIDSAWFDVLFGQDIAVAMQKVALIPELLATRDVNHLLDTFVVVGRPRHPAKVLESLNSMFATRLAVTEAPYKQWTINHFVVENGASVYYALTDGFLIAGPTIVPVRRCLDQSLDAGTSFMNSPAYNRYCAGLFKSETTHLLAYADMQYLLKAVNDVIDHEVKDKEQVATLHQQLAKLNGLATLNLAAYGDDGPVAEVKTLVGLDPETLSESLRHAIRISPGDNPTLQNAPGELLAYSWQNNFDLKYYWEEMVRGGQLPPEEIRAIEARFQQTLGMPLAPVLDALGTQAGFLVNDLNMDGLFPIPEIALFIQVRQPEVIDRLIRTNVEKALGAPMQTEQHNDVTLQYITLPLGDSLSPAYTIRDGFCTIAINRKLLKRMLDAPAQGGLATRPEFKNVDQGLTDKNNQMFFVRSARAVEKTRQALNWLMSWAALVKPQQRDQLLPVIQFVVNPILDGLKVMQSVSGRTVVSDDRISSDVTVLLDRS